MLNEKSIRLTQFTKAHTLRKLEIFSMECSWMVRLFPCSFSSFNYDESCTKITTELIFNAPFQIYNRIFTPDDEQFFSPHWIFSHNFIGNAINCCHSCHKNSVELQSNSLIANGHSIIQIFFGFCIWFSHIIIKLTRFLCYKTVPFKGHCIFYSMLSTRCFYSSIVQLNVQHLFQT